MQWLFFALLAPLIYTIVNFVDKYILEREVKDYRGMPLYSAIAAFFFGIVFWIINGFHLLAFHDALLIISVGMLTIFGSAIYFKVASEEDMSVIILIFQLIPLMVLVLSYFFLHEYISLKQFFGFLIMFMSSIMIVRKKGMVFHSFKSFFFMLIVDFFWALSYIFFKYVVEQNSFVNLISYESFGWLLGGLVLYIFFPSIKNSFFKTLKQIKKLALLIIFLNEGLYVIGKICTFFAISLGAVTLVSILGSTSVFYGIVLGWVLTIIAPRIFRENISRQGLVFKVILSIILFTGVILIS